MTNANLQTPHFMSRDSHGATMCKIAYRSSFFPGLHDIRMVFEKTL